MRHFADTAHLTKSGLEVRCPNTNQGLCLNHFATKLSGKSLMNKIFCAHGGGACSLIILQGYNGLKQ